MSKFHKFKIDDGEYIKVPVNRDVNLGMFNKKSQVSASLSYSLLNKTRNAKTGKGVYGADKMYFPRLYEILSTMYNGNVPFIDEYLEKLPRREAGKAVKEYLTSVADAMLSKKEALLSSISTMKGGKIKKLAATVRALTEFDEQKKRQLDESARSVEEAIQDDIVRLLASGRLPMRKKYLSDATMLSRKYHGLDVDPTHVFYASGQLARAFRLHFEVDVHGV